MKTTFNIENIDTDKLIEKYFEEYKYDNRLSELFDLIDEDKLREYLISEFERDYSKNDLKDLFEYEN